MKKKYIWIYSPYLAYANVVNLLGDVLRTIERNTDILLNVCKEIDLAANLEKSKNM